MFSKKAIKSKMVEHYRCKDNIVGGEISFYLAIKNFFSTCIFLDIGVGGGRTSEYFIDRCSEYVGIDVMPEMIDVCKKRFENDTRMHFETMDAVNLTSFSDKKFSAILFSFNGIDYIDSSRRNDALKEIQRVLTDDGLFCFSFHNILHLKTQYQFTFYRKIKAMLLEPYRWLFLRIKNGSLSKLLAKQFSMVYDGDNWFTDKYLYVDLKYQLDQLDSLGFKTIEICNYGTGEIIDLNSKNNNLEKVPWFGLICRKK